MTDPLRHLVCEIRENDIPPFRTNCFKAWGPCISAMKFPGFSNMSTSCLTATVSLCNWYTYWQMASFQSLDATVHKNITSTHSYTQFLLSQINPICTINFFLGTLYVCNGGWILTVVRAQQRREWGPSNGGQVWQGHRRHQRHHAGRYNWRPASMVCSRLTCLVVVVVWSMEERSDKLRFSTNVLQTMLSLSGYNTA